MRRTLALRAIADLGLATIGSARYQQIAKEEVGGSSALYLSAPLFSLRTLHFERQVPWTLQLARWLAPIALLLGLLRFARRIRWQETSHRSQNRLGGRSTSTRRPDTGNIFAAIRRDPKYPKRTPFVVTKDPTLAEQ